MIRTLLSLLNPECAHNLAVQLVRLRYAAWMPNEMKPAQKPVDVMGLHFNNPVGLAAGWDKDGVCFDALFRMGFGFVEVGGVTPQPQAGNPKPRVFRIPKQQALINRMGFHNAGVDALVTRLQTRKVTGVLGVNIAKNLTTPLSQALDDYRYCLKAVYPLADYIVVNISSPNTPELRELQSEKYLQTLLQGLNNTKKEMAGMYDRDVPLLVKTSVDLPQSDYAFFLQTVIEAEINGLIISNTTVDHTAVLTEKQGNEAGGLSGKPLLLRAVQMVRDMKAMAGGALTIIGCGGILSGADARLFQDAGASLFQIMTGFVYRGPELINEIITNII
ncbi:MAG: dihydroorotate dehydrogenase (quinone) [Gammaproteobacteria bacterium RIFCSPLOWO2_02_FULL_42_14]|nr:MAG: dihydroorotate dehydrogenase (quinone) [Gammaproteobacteria bacterium RIFCSPHIGHO2_02_FULL_42_43]OGT52340.1 MAG: dihydroorotate dehydrogenase (quinone) [Gammaproteobacteria bacterium RIFCSPHIGHO2_12_FULL_41_25]OGT61951.1 MAG: dihydroorotate dehydrogenase (quinone) [Gammaproteobacteria bacterium RIFCSPLOWO2_02_FULL_42_14]OGT86337.1 MAG: dihydroorotate dehydrogenase (quinone) [Gammaproteobacteria bacterium RIFCSPLOWO2_12_FULL_42_18]